MVSEARCMPMYLGRCESGFHFFSIYFQSCSVQEATAVASLPASTRPQFFLLRDFPSFCVLSRIRFYLYALLLFLGHAITSFFFFLVFLLTVLFLLLAAPSGGHVYRILGGGRCANRVICLPGAARKSRTRRKHSSRLAPMSKSISPSPAAATRRAGQEARCFFFVVFLCTCAKSGIANAPCFLPYSCVHVSICEG